MISRTHHRSQILAVAAFLAYAWLLPTPAYAYLDPGSGSILLYALLGLLAAAAYAVKGLLYRVRNAVLGLFSKKVDTQGELHDIVIFSEGGQYWSTFAPVIRALSSKGHRVSYLTQSPNDEGLRHSDPNLASKYIGSGPQSFAYMNRIRAKVVAMTTPQLDIMMLRRSKRVGHYMHIVHAPTDALVYKKFAFDYFDSVCCSGPHQVESIRQLEQLRRLPAKALPITGLNYYDHMLENRPSIDTEARTVLVAPTWGRHALFAKRGVEFIRDLVTHGYRVIVRPHPQVKKSQPEVFAALQRFCEGGQVELDQRPSAIESLARAAVLVSDLSGIIFDCLFVFEKPVISIDPYFDGRGHEAEDLEKTIWEVGVVEQLCTVISGDQLQTLPSVLERTLGAPLPSAVATVRREFVAHFGAAGEATADAIVAQLEASGAR